MRQGDNLPIAHVMACFCLLSQIHLQQEDAAVGGKDVQRDLSQPTCRNISVYLLHLPCQGKLQRTKELRWFQTCPSWNSQAAAVPHNDPFKSGAELDRHLCLDPSDGLVQTARCTSYSKRRASRTSLSRGNRDDEKEQLPIFHLKRCQYAPALLCPLQVRCPFFLSLPHSHTRIICLKVARWLKSSCFL